MTARYWIVVAAPAFAGEPLLPAYSNLLYSTGPDARKYSIVNGNPYRSAVQTTASRRKDGVFSNVQYRPL